MTDPSTIAASLTPKMREALEKAVPGTWSDMYHHGPASMRLSKEFRRRSEHSALHRLKLVGKTSEPRLTGLGLAVREALLEGKG